MSHLLGMRYGIEYNILPGPFMFEVSRLTELSSTDLGQILKEERGSSFKNNSSSGRRGQN